MQSARIGLIVLACLSSAVATSAKGEGQGGANERRATSDEAAALVDGKPIFLRDVDAPSREKIDRLRAELARVFAAAVDDVVDTELRRLPGAGSGPTPVPVSDAAVSDFLVARPQEFDGSHGPAAAADAAVARAAIRTYLESQARAAAEAQGRQRRRQAHRVELALPDAAELDDRVPSARTVVAIDGRPVPASAPEETAALRLYHLRGELYRERRRNLDVAVDAVLLAREAARRGTSVTALDPPPAAVAITDAELEAFIERERAAGRPVPDRERARPYLAFQQAHARRTALLDRLRAGARIEIRLREPEVPLLPVLDGGPTLGGNGGRRLVVYTNYRCRICRLVHAEFARLLAADPTLRVILRDFIPAYDPAADEAARLARCASQLGGFEPVRRALLASDPPPFGQPWYGAADRLALARAAGIDPAGLEHCLVAAETGAAIARDSEEARRLGFEEPPAFIAGGVPLSGMQSADGLARALDQAAQRVNH
jgi:hypothetical protein